ncbi:hypothetical protein CCP2SC5_740004 [Azospirillaceae bacterium]
MTSQSSKPKVGIVLSRLSRYDVQNGGILVGPAAKFVTDCVAAAGLAGADIYPVEYHDDDTLQHMDYWIITGDAAVKAVTGQQINNIRGRLIQYRNTPAVCTFSPQDCCDPRNFEGSAEDDGDEGTGKDTAPTAFRNYRGWFAQDVKKLRCNIPNHADPSCRREAARSPLVVMCLLKAIPAGSTIYFDIESNIRTNMLSCWSINCNHVAFGHLVYDYRGQLQPMAVEVLAELAQVFERTTVVIHNSSFDLPFLACFHGIPFGRQIRDTMLQHHRLFPELEKSLAHCISLYTNLPNHKGMSINETHNYDQDSRLLEYNLQDVVALRAVDVGQSQVAASLAGAQASIDQVNRSIYPYLIAGMHGIRVDPGERMMAQLNGAAKAAQLERIARVLVGWDIELASNPQAIRYFHTQMEYDAVDKTATGAPSLKGAALYKLKLKYPHNPMLDVLLRFRETAKATSMLHFLTP